MNQLLDQIKELKAHQQEAVSKAENLKGQLSVIEKTLANEKEELGVSYTSISELQERINEKKERIEELVSIYKERLGV